MTFEYVGDNDELPKPKGVLASTDVNVVVPIIFEFLSKMASVPDKTGIAAIQIKLDSNTDESDQAVEFLQRFKATNKVQFRVKDGSLFHYVSDRKTTPLDRIVYIVQIP